MDKSGRASLVLMFSLHKRKYCKVVDSLASIKKERVQLFWISVVCNNAHTSFISIRAVLEAQSMDIFELLEQGWKPLVK